MNTYKYMQKQKPVSNKHSIFSFFTPANAIKRSLEVRTANGPSQPTAAMAITQKSQSWPKTEKFPWRSQPWPKAEKFPWKKSTSLFFRAELPKAVRPRMLWARSLIFHRGRNGTEAKLQSVPCSSNFFFLHCSCHICRAPAVPCQR